MIIHYHIIEYHIILHIIHTSLLWFDLESKEHSLEMSSSSLCCFDAFSCELILVLNKQLNETCVLRQKQRGILSEVVRMHEADEIKACNLGQLLSFSFSCEFTGHTESYCWWWTIWIHERPEICSGREKRCWASETSSQPLSHKYHEAFTLRMNEIVWNRFSSASGTSKLLSALTFLSKFGCKEYAKGKMHQIWHHFPAVPNIAPR